MFFFFSLFHALAEVPEVFSKRPGDGGSSAERGKKGEDEDRPGQRETEQRENTAMAAPPPPYDSVVIDGQNVSSVSARDIETPRLDSRFTPFSFFF